MSTKTRSDFYFPNPQTDAEWDALAAKHGVESGAALREEVRLSEELLAEILAEEKAAKPV